MRPRRWPQDRCRPRPEFFLLRQPGRPAAAGAGGPARALNPSTKLDRIARDERWPIAKFGSRGRPSLSQFIRSVAATSSLVTSFVAGLPIYALTGSRRESQNFSFSLFADTASALIGMDLNVTGEEHLWSHRPAVFVFNHQSKADVIIIAKLLRRDIAGIGKQEIKKETPILGKVLELGGVVFIDRANARSAIDAMARWSKPCKMKASRWSWPRRARARFRPDWRPSRRAPSTWRCRPVCPWYPS